MAEDRGHREMLVPEIAPYIKDNNNCKSHGKDMYIQMMEYIAYDGAYDKDTHTFIYDSNAEYTGDAGEMVWYCGHCDRMIEWVGHEPKVEAE